VPPIAKADRIDLRATNLSTVTVNLPLAGVTCMADVKVQSDGPLVVKIAGCGASRRRA
jgi:hypothetical protein